MDCWTKEYILKIMYDIDIFAMQKFGGISRYYIELARSINRQSNIKSNVRIMDGVHRNTYLKHYAKETHRRSLYIPDFRGAGPVLKQINRVSKVLNSLAELDVYHATYYNFPRHLANSVYKVVTVYDMIHEIYPQYFPLEDQTRKIKLEAVRQADHIFAISKNTKKDLIKFYGINEKKISVTYLGVDHLKKTLRINYSKENFLLYVGPRSGYKNFESLLRAFQVLVRAFPKLKLVAFGGGGLSSDERMLIDNLGLDDTQISQVSGMDSDLSDLYMLASVFVYPSLYEGFGIPPLEAMTHGCAVAASDTSSISEVLGDAAALFDPEDTSDIVRKISSVLENRTQMEDLIQRGVEHVKRYTWDGCAKKTLQTYRKLI